MMRTSRVLLMVLPAAMIVFASGCKGDNLNKVPTCMDGEKNQDETDKDCGGLTCPPCKGSATCQQPTDCLIGICEGGNCLGGDAPLTAAQLCALYYAAYQNTRASDGSFWPDGYPVSVCTQAPIFDARKFDTDQLGYLCRPGTPGYKWGQSLVTAVNENRVDINWVTAKTCLEGSRQLRSNTPGIDAVSSTDWMTLKLGACTAFYEGKIPANGACKEDWDCMGDMGCYTDSPTVGGSRKCMAGAQANRDCTEWHPCAPGLTCSNGTCLAKGGTGADCYYGSDCLSGVCDPSTYSCFSGPTKAIGDECVEDQDQSSTSIECNIPSCGSCRPTEATARPTCQLNGKEGEYCRTWNDCAWDLGCVNNVCATSPIGALCGPVVQGLCATGAVCIPPVACELITSQASCEGDTSCGGATCCLWDEYYGCSPTTGTCVGEGDLPETGACYGPGVCASRAFCNDNNECVLLGTAGATCDPLHQCNSGLGYVCVDGRCIFACQYSEDCPAHNYCDLSSSVTACQEINEAACTIDQIPQPDGFSTAVQNTCGPDKYCDVPGMWCGWHASQATCQGDTECSYHAGTCVTNDSPCSTNIDRNTCNADASHKCEWLATTNCGAPDCASATGDLACQAIVGCQWTPPAGATPGSCDPTCYNITGDVACGNNTGCVWVDDSYGGMCYTKCDLISSQSQAACTGLPPAAGCRWAYLACRSIENCAPMAGQDDVCSANDYCAVGDASTCDVVSNVTTGVCVATLNVGENAQPDNLLGAYFTGSGASVMCKSGYSMADAAGETFLCAEPASAPGCSSNEALKTFIHVAFLFGGVLFLNRSRRRRI